MSAPTGAKCLLDTLNRWTQIRYVLLPKRKNNIQTFKENRIDVAIQLRKCLVLYIRY